jgi:hypothetical protein
MDQVLSAGAAGQKRQGREVDAGAEHGGDDVAAGEGSGGRGAHEPGQQGRETGSGQGESDAWRPPKQEVERQRRDSGGRGSCTVPVAEEAEQGSRGR